jgi:hypothetical protein
VPPALRGSPGNIGVRGALIIGQIPNWLIGMPNNSDATRLNGLRVSIVDARGFRAASK